MATPRQGLRAFRPKASKRSNSHKPTLGAVMIALGGVAKTPRGIALAPPSTSPRGTDLRTRDGCRLRRQIRALDQSLTVRRFGALVRPPWKAEKPVFAGVLSMELAGLDPATSWVRSRFKRARVFHASSSHFTNHPISRDFRAFIRSGLHCASRAIALRLCQKRVALSCLISQQN